MKKLVPYKGLSFRLEHFSDQVVGFVLEKDKVTSFKPRDPSGEYVFPEQAER